MAPIMPKPPRLRIDLSAVTRSPRTSSLTPRLSRWVFGESMSFRTAGGSSDSEFSEQAASFEKYSPDVYKNKASRRVLLLFVIFH